MRLLLQKVSKARVIVDKETIGSIQDGYVLFLGVLHGDTAAQADWLADKVLSLRLYATEEGDNKQTILEHGGSILLVSQFTLAAQTDRGTKPDYGYAAPGPVAEPLYLHFAEALRSRGILVETGRFGAFMSVELTNEGPYTLWLDR
ncbi:D-tyrosyl-tRNA(Tyr) deacylase [Candidatus Peribacteria bacterium]|nr:MAG: D-tyrosyl-tRNA(Tyr) deacylase [Candidatus Peribacteria bacterium]